ncbi:hypothetical protein [Qipengyuania sp. ASV99]|uniref:hypothetical protein n=1 Tax=Qipengyuania sp. ASV99 TaxID=3399681 RepID=UPI003A4C74B5
MNNVLGGRPETPWHLWVVGIVSLLWNSGGANDYVQVKLRSESYLQQGADMTGNSVEQISAYYDAFPIWADAAWAFGVWGAVAGSLLLLLRSKFALHAFGLSLLGLIVSTIYGLTAPMPPVTDPELAASAQTFQLIFSAVIWIVTLLLIFYSSRMQRAGVLR